MAQVHFTNRSDWRAWLRKNGKEEPEVWLLFYKKHTEKPTLSYDAAVSEALCYGWIDSIVRKIDEERYEQKFTPRKETSRWSKSNKERVAKLIEQKKMTKVGLALVEAAKANGRWDEESVVEMPSELEDRLAKNRKAKANFEDLAPSYQRQYIGWIGSAKREATREKRAKEAIQLLAQNKKLPMK